MKNKWTDIQTFRLENLYADAYENNFFMEINFTSGKTVFLQGNSEYDSADPNFAEVESIKITRNNSDVGTPVIETGKYTFYQDHAKPVILNAIVENGKVVSMNDDKGNAWLDFVTSWGAFSPNRPDTYLEKVK